MKNIYLLATTAILLSSPAHAVLKLSDIKGNQINLAVPGKRAEICVIAQRFPEAKYAKKDDKHETELCALEASVNVATCAKTYSTNPGVLFVTPPKGTTLEDLQAQECDVKGAKKEAKYKNSTSCSYTPSLLAYYHVSRALGNVVNVPPAVLRTMDLERHQTIASRAIKNLADDPQELIYKTWSGLKSILDKGARSEKADLLFVEGFEQSYGALQRNPRGEEFYQEFFNKGADRVEAFKNSNKIYKELTESSLNVGREFTLANVQKIQQLKDLADMLVMDTVLAQQDRFGNIHYKEKYLYPTTNKKGKFEIKDEDKDDLDKIPAELQSKAVLVKEMMLKDNDCGVTKENKIKKAKLLDQISHIDPKTYKRLLKMEAAGDANKEYFMGNLMFTESDYRTVMGNLREAVSLLKSACESGKLKLDLNMEDHFSGEAPAAANCGI